MLSALRSKSAWQANSDRLHLFDIPIDRVDRDEAISTIEQWMDSPVGPKSIFTPDTTALMRARYDNILRRAYQNADLVTADGTGLIWASRLFGTPLVERVTGIDLMRQVCSSAAVREKRVYLLGAKPGVAEDAATFLENEYANLNICGLHHGYLDESNNSQVIDDIKKAAPDILFVAMGVPLQERWIIEHIEKLDVPIVMGVGGSFDVLAGRVERAPIAWQKSGFEWLWRTIQEPWRWKRLRVIPIFLIQLLFYRTLGWVFASF